MEIILLQIIGIILLLAICIFVIWIASKNKRNAMSTYERFAGNRENFHESPEFKKKSIIYATISLLVTLSMYIITDGSLRENGMNFFAAVFISLLLIINLINKLLPKKINSKHGKT